jgi:ATP-dependent RNA helicase DDX51/DBP6
VEPAGDVTSEEEGSAEDAMSEKEPLEEVSKQMSLVEERPRKRRKVIDSDVVEDVDLEMVEYVDGPEEASVVPDHPKSPVPQEPTTLPIFPLPAVPNPPSKAELALQGLDKAFLDAEIVDPATSLRIPSEGEDDAARGLSEKTRRRLKELGITELFAGEYV